MTSKNTMISLFVFARHGFFEIQAAVLCNNKTTAEIVEFSLKFRNQLLPITE